MNDEMYFVTSNGDEPEQIFFTKEQAFNVEAAYVDSFDEEGKRVTSYAWDGGEYTTHF